MYKEENRQGLVPFIMAFALTALTAVLLSFKFDFLLVTNDDITLRNIASGTFTGTPDAHLIYIMYPLGLIFKALYSVFPALPWYDIFMTGMHFVCLFIILFRTGILFERISNRIVAMLVSFSLFLIFELSQITFHQYTVLAAVLMGTGLFRLTTADYLKKRRSGASLMIILFILAMWVRKQVFFLGLPLVVLSIAFNIFEKNDTYDERFERFKTAISPMIVALVLIVASFAVEYFAYSSPEWKAFKAYNEARTDVYDFDGLPDYYSDPSFYEELGISEAQYSLLRRYDLALLDEVDTDTLRALSDKAELNKKEWARFYSVPRKVINDTVKAMYAKNNGALPVALTIVFFVLFIFFMVRDRKLAGAVVFVTYVFEWLFIGYFTYLDRLPERVTHGFFLMEFMFLTGVFVREVRRLKNQRTPSLYWQIFAGIFFASIFTMTGLSAYTTTTSRLMEKQQVLDEWKELNLYLKHSPENIYILNTAAYAATCDSMFSDEITDAHNTVTSNWTIGGPLFEAHLNKLGVTTSIKEALKQDNVFFVQNVDKDLACLADCFGNAAVVDSIVLSNGKEYEIISLK